jgi:hypothetical protein
MVNASKRSGFIQVYWKHTAQKWAVFTGSTVFARGLTGFILVLATIALFTTEWSIFGVVA